MQDSPAMGTRATAPTTKSAVIGPGIEISGDVTANADLTIDGKVNGSVVQSVHNVDIGESGQVRARIQAKLVKIAGAVLGDIAGSEKVLITRTGRVQGNIVAPRVQLEDGAIFKGSIDMNPAETAKPEASATKPAAPAAKKTEAAPAAARSSASAAAKPAAKAAGSAQSGEPSRKEPSLTLKSG